MAGLFSNFRIVASRRTSKALAHSIGSIRNLSPKAPSLNVSDIITNTQAKFDLKDSARLAQARAGATDDPDGVSEMQRDVKQPRPPVGLNLHQSIKLLRELTEGDLGNQQLIDVTVSRIKEYILGGDATIEELLHVMKRSPKSLEQTLAPFAEERLQEIMAIGLKSDLGTQSPDSTTLSDSNYRQLCQILLETSASGKRPVSLLKAVTLELSRRPTSDTIPGPGILVATLKALASLRYTQRSAVQRLLNDLSATVNLDILPVPLMCDLLSALGLLRWRPDELLGRIVGAIHDRHDGLNYQLVETLINVSAILGYRPSELVQLYNSRLKLLEPEFPRSELSWLRYVSSLACLELVDDSHLKSVLNTKFFNQVHHSHQNAVLRLQNLSAVARLEKNLKGIDYQFFENLNVNARTKNEKLQRFGSLVSRSLSSLQDSNKIVRYDIRTPFGIVIDCELALDEEVNLLPLTSIKPAEELFLDACSDKKRKKKSTHKETRVAVIYTQFFDTIANKQPAVVGYRKLQARILGHLGYQTRFLYDGIIQSDMSSSEITRAILSALRRSSPVIREPRAESSEATKVV